MSNAETQYCGNLDTASETEGSDVRCPDSRGCNVCIQGVWDSKMCPVYQGVLISECPE